MQVSGLTVQLQHVIHTPRKREGAGQWLTGPAAAGAPAADSAPGHPTAPGGAAGAVDEQALNVADDRASSAPSRRSHHRAKSRFGGGGADAGSKGGGTSGAGYAASLFSDAAIAGRAADSAFEQANRMRDWSAGYMLSLIHI